MTAAQFPDSRCCSLYMIAIKQACIRPRTVFTVTMPVFMYSCRYANEMYIVCDMAVLTSCYPAHRMTMKQKKMESLKMHNTYTVPL